LDFLSVVPRESPENKKPGAVKAPGFPNRRTLKGGFVFRPPTGRPLWMNLPGDMESSPHISRLLPRSDH
jgi:hypothetical protein